MSETAGGFLDRVPAAVRPAVRLLVQTATEALEDRVPGLAAEMAFYLVLSLAPLLITVFTGIAVADDALGTQVVETATQQAEQVAGEFLSADAAAGFADILATIREQQAAAGLRSLLSFGFLATVFSASRVFRVTAVAISIAYDLADNRPAWKQALLGLLLALSGIAVGIVVIPLLIAGPRLGEWLARPLGLSDVFTAVWAVAYWPVTAIVATLGLMFLYHIAAPWHTPWRRDLPGAVLAMVVGLAGSAALQVYTSRTLTGEETVFGFLAAPLVLLLWLYVMSFAVLLGAEFNAEIERMWPSGAGAPR